MGEERLGKSKAGHGWRNYKEAGEKEEPEITLKGLLSLDITSYQAINLVLHVYDLKIIRGCFLSSLLMSPSPN